MTLRSSVFVIHKSVCSFRREIEILGLLGKGYISKEIADRLYISVNTVNNHRQNIIRKMGLLNTSEALAYAQKTGIV